ncbi:Uncharacterised protein [BD1-7 clade bacterium]|uniref:Aspartyl/asparaginy/proline hydroxylase domain-containing protein n=1 Tax=BD1-7 clade bacterium TaxID=2029982 RepID=A0A5S9QFZ9_9GAMM|nr:Uncharacterised protein [BD1-7 clade bacterium]
MHTPPASSAFYALEDFPTLQALTGQWHIIADEAEALTRHTMPIDRIQKSHVQVHEEILQYMDNGGEYGWTLGFGGVFGPNPNWLQFGLVLHDHPVAFAQSVMPQTLALLASISGIHVAALVRMKPQTLLPTHVHAELKPQQLLQYHLTLRCAAEHNFAYLNVDGEFRQHTAGNAFVFDGSRPHFAVNASHAERWILYLEFHQPTVEISHQTTASH